MMDISEDISGDTSSEICLKEELIDIEEGLIVWDEGQECLKEELIEIEELQGLNVWGERQEFLEEQALKELEIFAKENSTTATGNDVTLEEGEIEEAPEKAHVLDINSYIKSQEEFKKRQDYKRSLQVDQGKEAVVKKCKKVKRNIDSVASSSSPVKQAQLCDDRVSAGSGSEYVPSEDDGSDNETLNTAESKRMKSSIKQYSLQKVKDDGCPKAYKSRLDAYYKYLENHPDEILDEDVVLQGGLKIPSRLWDKLYSYQQEGVRWLWKLHQEKSGGLLGDEMGLGKTVQVIVFLAGLDHSHQLSRSYMGLGPTLIVSPATVIHQWVKHFHEWAPEFRVAVLHQSGSYEGSKVQLIKDINKCNGVLITSYSGVLKYKGNLVELSWHYVLLDEGHKIRNSGAKVTVAVKQLRTPHRIMLTGSPMQNNLQELWSLFDFVVPGVLGTLSTFMEHFSNPIMHGGYANATPMQEATALSVATALKDLISPFLLRRSKNEVKEHICLPGKSEQVLFCSLTNEQTDIYKSYLLGERVSMILGRGSKNWFSENQQRGNVLVAITTLRKICNHPDLYLGDDSTNYNKSQESPEESFGYYKRSGKMVVVSALLKIWKKQKHRVLLFTQARAMINVFEEFLRQQGYKYLKMDGGTSINSRQPLIDKFNQDISYDVFILTTRVGGLGINLTGANRVIIYDPDWNPATDTQARERAWRIGQDKQVTIYRLITSGTIEEKIYQRQVWKQLLSNKILLDPRTQKFFKTSDLHDLFSLQEQVGGSNPETANIFKNSRVNLQEKINNKKQNKKLDKESEKADKATFQFSDDKIQAMKSLAQQIAKNLSKPQENENPKSGYQKALEVEREQKLKEKRELKKLTPMELLQLNRNKAAGDAEDAANKIDDYATGLSFDGALNIAERTSKIYHAYKEHKIKADTSGVTAESSVSSNEEVKPKHKKKKKKKSDKKKIDTSGTVDGEVVEGLVKRETKKEEKVKRQDKNESQDDYVLGKLFSRKGVHSALQHDSIVQINPEEKSKIKIHWEAQQRTELALAALRKSRLTSWRW